MKIDLPWPAKALWPNGRAHYMAKAREVKKHRSWGNLAALEALGGTTFAHTGATIPITLHVHPKPKGPLPDRDNCIAACKSLLDGIADALGVNDSAFDIQPVQFSDERDGRIVVEVGHG